MNSFYIMSTNELQSIKEDKLEIDRQGQFSCKAEGSAKNKVVIAREYFNNDNLCSKMINILYNLVMILFFLSFLSKSNILIKLSKVKFVIFTIITISILLSTSVILDEIIARKYESLYLVISYVINLVIIYYLFPVFLYSIDFKTLYGKMKNISNKMNNYSQSIANMNNQPIINNRYTYNPNSPVNNMNQYPSVNMGNNMQNNGNQVLNSNMSYPNNYSNVNYTSLPQNNTSVSSENAPNIENNTMQPVVVNSNNTMQPTVSNVNNSDINHSSSVSNNVQNNISSNVSTQKVMAPANHSSTNAVNSVLHQHQFNK